MTWRDLLFVLPFQVALVVLGFALLARRERFERRIFSLSLLAHQLSALAIIVVTEVYYGGGDMIMYHRMGKFLAARLRSDFLGFAPDLLAVVLQSDRPLPIPGTVVGSNTGSIQALSGFLMFVFQDSLPAACAVIALGSFWAKLKIYDALRGQLPHLPKAPLLYGCMLLPSAIFWSSGLLKEPIAVVGLAILISATERVARLGASVGALAAMVLGVGLVGLFKGYLLPPFGLGIGMWAFARAVRGQERVKTRYLVLAVVVAVGAMFGTGAWLPEFAPGSFEDEARVAQEIGARTLGGSNYSLGEGGSLLSQLPLAIGTSLFRPLLFEADSIVLFANALEMAWITWLVVLGLARRSPAATVRFILTEPALAFCAGFVLTLAVGIGITSTNLGTLSRYRMPLLPLYVSLVGVLAARPGRQEDAVAVPPRPAPTAGPPLLGGRLSPSFRAPGPTESR